MACVSLSEKLNNEIIKINKLNGIIDKQKYNYGKCMKLLKKNSILKICNSSYFIEIFQEQHALLNLKMVCGKNEYFKQELSKLLKSEFELDDIKVEKVFEAPYASVIFRYVHKP